MSPHDYDAVIVISFGGPEGPDDVIAFIDNVAAGRDIPPERLAEVAEVYMSHGGVSPLNQQNRTFITQLEQALAGRGIKLPVYFGNRNWHPFLADTAKQMHQDGIRRALGFVTSAFSSYSSCRQYLENIEAACAGVGAEAGPAPGLEIHKLRGFFNHPQFVAVQAELVSQAVGTLLAQGIPLDAVRILFCAHSLPVAMAEVCDYELQLRETARLTMAQIDWPQLAQAEAGTAAWPHGWDLVWQSRSGPPQVKWLAPDIGDHLPAVAFFGRGPERDGRCQGVVAVPLGFLSENMEVLFDLDQTARQVAQDYKLKFARAAAASSSDKFADLVADLVAERISGSDQRPHLGELSASPDFCAPGCCL